MVNFRSLINSRFLTFTNFLLFLISVTILFTLVVLLNIHQLLDILPTSGSDSIGLNNILFSKIPINEIIALIAGVLGAILAIVFSLTIISIESISEKYSPHILDKFVTHHKTRFTLYIFILVIVASVSLFLVKELISTPLLLFYLILLVFGFVLCFIMLIKYFDFIFIIVNPIKFAPILTEEINGYIKKDRKSEAESIITTLGDIAIKSLIRQEKDIARKYISELYGIFLQSISEFQKFDYLHMILDSYQRILDYCIEINSELRFKILDVYAEITTIFFSTKISNKFDKSIFHEYENYLKKLFYANKEIINKNDFELFKSEIDSISKRFVDDPKELIEKIKIQLLFVDFNHPQLHQDNEIILKRKYLNVLLDNLGRNFSNFENYITILDEFLKFNTAISKFLAIKEDKTKIESLFEEIRNNLFKFYLDSNFHNTFLLIGAYCIFVQKERNIESSKYIRELWLHANPEDANGITVNKVPVSSDIEFLCNMLFWGGKNSGFWYDGYDFEGFHGSKSYLYTYFLLLLTYLREKLNKEFNIQISKDMGTEELKFKYSFLKQFISEVKELINYCDNLILESAKWIFLFPTKRHEIRDKTKAAAEPKIIEVTTKEQFENTKKWLENNKIEFEEKIKEIETYLPLETEKIDECKKETLASFNKHSEMFKAANLKEFDITKDKSIEFSQISYRPIIPKDCFFKASYVYCSALWFEYGRTVAFGEINYFIKKILNNPDIEKIEIDDGRVITKIYYEIENTINSLKEKGFNPSTIFLPLDYLSKFCEEGLKKESKLYGKFSFSDRQFRFNESTKLDIVHSSNYRKFENILIFDKKVNICTFKTVGEDKERLHVEIKEYEKDSSKIDLTVKTVINLKIENSDAIKILIIKNR